MRVFCWMQCRGLISHRERQLFPFPCAHTRCHANSPFQTDARLCQSVGVKFSLCCQPSWETDTRSVSHLPDATVAPTRSASPSRYKLARGEKRKKEILVNTERWSRAVRGPRLSSPLPCRQWPAVTVGSIPNLFNYIWECFIERPLGGREAQLWVFC